MKVLFIEHVVHVGKPWEIREVGDSYARNFLIPKSLAKKVTPQMEKNLAESQKKQESNRRELLWDKHNIVKKLNGKTFTFSLSGSPKGKVYGSIWEKDIIARIKKDFHIELSKKHIDFPNGHLKNFWTDFVYVTLGKDAIAKVIVELKPL